jgi:arginine-tRNA-protein transferase
MAEIRPPPAKPRPFYQTAEQLCPYLPGRLERRIVTFLSSPDDEAIQDELALAGFRRSQNMLYRPQCHGCAACVPVRIVVRGFRPGRTLRRVIRRNAGLRATERPARATDEQFALFRRYLLARHAGGGMAEMTRQDYADMVAGWSARTRIVEFREPDGRLVAVSLTDLLRSGLSGVYKFFEPEPARRSLGSYVVAWHVQRAAELGLPYVYLGYWIAGSAKMAYKARFAPLERLGPEGWEPMPPSDPAGED